MFPAALSGTRPASDEVRQRVHARLDQLGCERADLAPAIDLQRTLLNRQIDLLDVIAAGGLPGLSLPSGYVTAKLRRGIPVLHGEPIPLPSRLLLDSVREFCSRLEAGGAGHDAAAVAQAIDAGGLDGAALLSACFGRDQRRVRLMAAQQQLSADIMWLTAELALAPFVHLLQLQVLARAAESGDAVHQALAGWDRGFCPACASWPAIIEAGDGHALRCSFCARDWELSTYRCVYCGNDGETFATAAPDPERTGRRLQLCGSCGGYAKVLETAEPTVFPLVAIEDLASLDLDMAAIEHKYMRPALPDIKKQ